MLPLLLLCGRNFVPACLIRLDVCFWHKADMLNALTNVRFGGKADSDPPLLTGAAHDGRRHDVRHGPRRPNRPDLLVLAIAALAKYVFFR
jgi:hypothetical protein